MPVLQNYIEIDHAVHQSPSALCIVIQGPVQNTCISFLLFWSIIVPPKKKSQGKQNAETRGEDYEAAGIGMEPMITRVQTPEQKQSCTHTHLLLVVGSST